VVADGSGWVDRALGARFDGGLARGAGTGQRTRPGPASWMRTGATSLAELRLEDVRVRHPGADLDALAAVDLEVEDGRRLVLLGGSGSGKTTLLRAVAGLVPVTTGRVLIGDRDVTRLPPGERDVALVHQEGVLQPHLDVRRNLGFSLRMRRVPRDEERRRVDAEAGAFGLMDLLGRRPSTLATGQRHEVALARTLVRRCAVLLLDEPFARVDAHRAATLRRELRRVQEGYGVTTLLSANDPVTAHALGDRIAVLDGGRLLQTGPPQDVAATPGSITVAELVVVPPMNTVGGTIEREDGGCTLVAGPLRLALRRALPTGRVTVGIRPGDLELVDRGVAVLVQQRTVLGHEVELTVGHPQDQVLRVTADRAAPPVGAHVRLRVRPERVHLFDADTGIALRHGV
jgi:multiple sugar transport system ATP-binding protein